MPEQIQPAIRGLLAIPGLLLSDEEPQEIVAQCVHCFDHIVQPMNHADVSAMLDLLTRSDDDMLETKWALLHAIEKFSGWPDWGLLNQFDGWWIDLLRLRCANAGLFPPQV